jgi:murein DD-endopeptidase MepM/ murein hydrolase activator NlpD
MNSVLPGTRTRFRGIILCLFLLVSASSWPQASVPEPTRAPAQQLPHALPLLSSLEEKPETGQSPAARLPAPEPAEDFAAPDQPRERDGIPAIEPLVITFPAPGPAPDNGWLPPLYSIPWAPTPYDHFYLGRPISANRINWARADYRYGGVFFEDVVHSGIDISAEVGTPILAAGSGKVTWAGYGINTGVYDVDDPYGQAVFIRHDFGHQGYTLYTLYAHLDRVDVVKGQRIQAGHVLGTSGKTGKTTGPHLHFELRLGKAGLFETRNPELWLVPPQGYGVLAGRVMNNVGGWLEGQLVSAVSRESGQAWTAFSYTKGGMVESDSYYQENVVIGDLPAGRYDIQIDLWGKRYTLETDILPGQVSYFTFRGRSGFTLEPLPLPGADFAPTP